MDGVTSTAEETNGINNHDAVAKVPKVEGQVLAGDVEYRVYSSRWFILFVFCFLNLSNAMMWLTFAPISDHTAEFYKVTFDQVNWLSLVFMIVSIPLGVAATWLLDTLGLRPGVILAAWLNLVGAIIRLISAIPSIPEPARFPVVITGQTLTALAQPFILEAPAKLAQLWFAENQRATANMIGSMSNPIGLLLANVISPAIVKSKADFLNVLGVYCAPAGVGVLLATFGICSSVPPSPPTASAAATSETFWQGIKKIVRNLQHWILLPIFGIGPDLFYTPTTILDQVLCPSRYDHVIVGAAVAGILVDKTKRFQEVVKVGFAGAAVALLGLSFLSRQRSQQPGIATLCGIFGFFGFALYPISMELAIEVTYPVAEATSSGLLIVSGQVWGIVLILITQAIAQPLSAEDTQHASCGTTGAITPQDMSIAMLVLAGVACLAAIIQIIFFRPTYKQLKAENWEKAVKVKKSGVKLTSMKPIAV
ncbi:solute carrier family 49 member A3-like [Branchiostoma floridae]|uniref:Solute carrier family 49 member A3-like n=1 Tax=Branchiostoma floridae TaxID=7739 RepID=A0A9J7KLX7_BRAFL|nr:solute carrier family 49 member A3-like [Branchiostoma floridae]